MQPTDLVRLRDDAAAAQAAYHAAILTAHQAGLSTRQIASIVGVSHGTIHTIVRRQRGD